MKRLGDGKSTRESGPDRTPSRMQQDGKGLKAYRLVILVAVANIALIFVAPDMAKRSGQTVLDYFIEMLLILPPVFILTGLLDGWVPKETVQRHMGTGSGIKGMAIAVLLGTATAGPLYAAFPIAVMMLEKGTRVANVVIFLSVWAGAKIPMVTMEAKFLGLSFAALRLVLTLIAAILIGLISERALRDDPDIKRISRSEADFEGGFVK